MNVVLIKLIDIELIIYLSVLLMKTIFFLICSFSVDLQLSIKGNLKN